MNKKPKKLEDIDRSKIDNDSWRVGFDSGMKHALRENDIALAIGRAILEVLDNRYEFKEEDY